MRQIPAKSKYTGKREQSPKFHSSHMTEILVVDINSKSKNIPLMTDDSRVKSCFLSCDCSLTKSGLKCWDKVYVSVYCVKARGGGWTSHISCLLKAKGKVLEALLYGREGGLENTLTAFPRPEVPVFWPLKCEVIVSPASWLGSRKRWSICVQKTWIQFLKIYLAQVLNKFSLLRLCPWTPPPPSALRQPSLHRSKA